MSLHSFSTHSFATHSFATSTAVRRAIAVFFACSLIFPVAAAARTVVEASQGSVVRWQGGAESCGMDGRTWKAVDETCYYAIDFELQPSRIEIARWRIAGGHEAAWVDVQEKDFGHQDIEFPDDHFVNLSKENLDRLYGEQSQIKPLFRLRTAARFEMPLAHPADSLPAGGGFGVTRTFNGEPKNAHTGTDYAIVLGTPVKSVAAGTVALVGEHFFSGRSVYVNHGNGLVSMYFHLDEISAEIGQEVAAGDQIGTVGSTGRSTGPHLHLGLRWRGARIDPALLLETLQVVDVP